MQLEKIINTAYSFGAAVVVFGAWAKIEHKDYSDNDPEQGIQGGLKSGHYPSILIHEIRAWGFIFMQYLRYG